MFVLEGVAFRKLYSGQGYKRDEPDEEAGRQVELISGGCGHEGIEMGLVRKEVRTACYPNANDKPQNHTPVGFLWGRVALEAEPRESIV